MMIDACCAFLSPSPFSSPVTTLTRAGAEAAERCNGMRFRWGGAVHQTNPARSSGSERRNSADRLLRMQPHGVSLSLCLRPGARMCTHLHVAHRGGFDMVQLRRRAGLHPRHVVHLLGPLAPLHPQLLLQRLPLLARLLLPPAHLRVCSRTPLPSGGNSFNDHGPPPPAAAASPAVSVV